MPRPPQFKQVNSDNYVWWRRQFVGIGTPDKHAPNDMRPQERDRKKIKARRKASARQRHRK